MLTDELQQYLEHMGLHTDALPEMMKTEQMQSLLGEFCGMAAQGGIMPDDAERLLEHIDADGLLEKMQDVFSGMFYQEIEEIDLDEEIAAYEPAAEDAADRTFVAVLKAWFRDTIAEITAEDVCALSIGYHLGYEDESCEQPHGDVWIAYNTAETDAKNRKNGAEAWNFCNWTDEYFRPLDDAPFTAWYQSQGYDLEADDDDLKRRFYDLAAVAVMDLHAERATEARFGRKIPVIIEDYEYNPMTAIRTAKINGKELLDKDFFAYCGFEDDETD